jgi:hypothetical protein
MLRDEADPYSAATFLESWGLEIRAGHTPVEELDVHERLNEYLDAEITPDVEARLTDEVCRETERLLREERDAEQRWEDATVNDRIATAFADLRGRGIHTGECAGITIQDGWGYVGLSARAGDVGAVFFHQEDVFDALHGLSMPLAYGGAGPEPEDRARASEIATATLEVLAAHGVPATWTGCVEDRLEILPFSDVDGRRRPRRGKVVPFLGCDARVSSPWARLPQATSSHTGPPSALTAPRLVSTRGSRT